jgi:hypothetical protein
MAPRFEATTPEFTDKEVELIAKSLPNGVDPQREPVDWPTTPSRTSGTAKGSPRGHHADTVAARAFAVFRRRAGRAGAGLP